MVSNRFFSFRVFYLLFLFSMLLFIRMCLVCLRDDVDDFGEMTENKQSCNNITQQVNKQCKFMMM